MNAWRTLSSISIAGLFVAAACDASPPTHTTVLEWRGDTIHIELDGVEEVAGHVTTRGTLDGVPFQMVATPDGGLEVTRTFEDRTERFAARLGPDGQLSYDLGFGDDAKTVEAVVPPSAMSLSPQDLKLLRYDAQLVPATTPLADAEDGGHAPALALLAETIDYWQQMGVSPETLVSVGATVGAVYSAVYFGEGTLWAGGVINGCESSCEKGNCECSQITCFAGSYPSGSQTCGCGPVSVGWGPWSGTASIGVCSCDGGCNECEGSGTVGSAEAHQGIE
jgi:hypothetical protein